MLGCFRFEHVCEVGEYIGRFVVDVLMQVWVLCAAEYAVWSS